MSGTVFFNAQKIGIQEKRNTILSVFLYHFSNERKLASFHTLCTLNKHPTASLLT